MNNFSLNKSIFLILIILHGTFYSTTNIIGTSEQSRLFNTPLIFSSPDNVNFGRFPSVLIDNNSKTIHFITTITEDNQLKMIYGFSSINSRKIEIVGKYPIASVTDLGTLLLEQDQINLVWSQNKGSMTEFKYVSWKNHVSTYSSLGFLNSSITSSLTNIKNIDAFIYNESIVVLYKTSQKNGSTGLGIWSSFNNIVLPIAELGINYLWDPVQNNLFVLQQGESITLFYQYHLCFNNTLLVGNLINDNNTELSLFKTKTSSLRIAGLTQNDSILFLNLNNHKLQLHQFDLNHQISIRNSTIIQDVFDYKSTQLNKSHLLVAFTKESEAVGNFNGKNLYYLIINIDSFNKQKEGFLESKQTLYSSDSWNFNLWSNSGLFTCSYFAFVPEDEARSHQIAFGKAIGVFVSSNLDVRFRPYYHDLLRFIIFILPEWIYIFSLIIIIPIIIIIFYRKKSHK